MDAEQFNVNSPALLTVRMLAARLGVSVDSVNRGIRSGAIPVIVLSDSPRARRYVPAAYLERIRDVGQIAPAVLPAEVGTKAHSPNPGSTS